jgi:hypothetical protein
MRFRDMLTECALTRFQMAFYRPVMNLLFGNEQLDGRASDLNGTICGLRNKQSKRIMHAPKSERVLMLMTPGFYLNMGYY